MIWTRLQKHLILLALLAQFIFAKASVDSSNVVPRIFNGNKKDIEQFPCIVSIQDTENCAGTIIDEMWILTAAKCAGKSNIKVRVGSAFREQDGVVHEVDTATIHPEYVEGNQENGIALLKLKKAIEFTTFAQPIRIPDADEGQVTTGQYCAAGSFAKNKNTDAKASVLKAAEVVTMTRFICQALVNVSMGDEFVCVQGVGNTAAGPCTGIGSPLICRCQQVGIFLGLEGDCGDPYKPPYYLKINKYKEWIRSVSDI